MVTQPSPYCSSFWIDEIDVHFDDGTRLELVCKNTSRRAMLPEARRVRPAFLQDPLREVTAYTTLLAGAAVGAPACHGAVVDARRDRYWLFLERIDGPPLSEIGEFETWLDVSAFLARMHASMPAEPAVDEPRLVRHDATFYRRWIRRAERFMRERTWESSNRRNCLRWLAAHHDQLIGEILDLPIGMIHGEFFASNVLIERESSSTRVRPLDWELAGIGPILTDLASLTSGNWTTWERHALACSYYWALQPPARARFGPISQFERSLECCRVQLALQYLGWARHWTPPANHARDWLAEAVEAADRLGW